MYKAWFHVPPLPPIESAAVKLSPTQLSPAQPYFTYKEAPNFIHLFILQLNVLMELLPLWLELAVVYPLLEMYCYHYWELISFQIARSTTVNPI